MPHASNTQFADFHGHGWVFRAVFKRDRQGYLLDADDKILPPKTSLRSGGAIARYPSRERHALRRIAISNRTAMATDTCMARRAMR